MKGQLSMEFMIVFVGMLMIVATVTYPLYDKARADAEKMTTLSDAREAANTLANALNTLYAAGPGSKQTVEYWLPKGTVGVYMAVDRDGIETTDENVDNNGRLDVQILLDLDGDGNWDNKREAVVLTDTILPSSYDEDGNARTELWENENAVHAQDIGVCDPDYRTHHRTTLEYIAGKPISIWGALLKSQQISNGQDLTIYSAALFGAQLTVKAKMVAGVVTENENFGGDFSQQSGDDGFTLSITRENVTAEASVTWVSAVLGSAYAQIYVRYWVTSSPRPKYIAVSDVILESV